MNLNEELRPADLRYLVDNVFEIDSYSSKMGNDQDVSVISFNVKSKDAAEDLESFIEKGYKFVLDADVSPGEVKEGKYKVFVEMERDKNLSSRIVEILDGVKKLVDTEDFRFRYYRSFRSNLADLESLTDAVPTTPNQYENKINEVQMENVDNFFNKSYLESIDLDHDQLTLEKPFNGSLNLIVSDFGRKQRIYESVQGAFQMNSSDISEILYLTKFIGPYNINKIDNKFIIENNGYALVAELRR
jgi:hypothetical protein